MSTALALRHMHVLPSFSQYEGLGDKAPMGRIERQVT